MSGCLSRTHKTVRGKQQRMAWTALHWAASYATAETMQMLLAPGGLAPLGPVGQYTGIHARDDHGATPLHHATQTSCARSSSTARNQRRMRAHPPPRGRRLFPTVARNMGPSRRTTPHMRGRRTGGADSPRERRRSSSDRDQRGVRGTDAPPHGLHTAQRGHRAPKQWWCERSGRGRQRRKGASSTAPDGQQHSHRHHHLPHRSAHTTPCSPRD